MKQKKYYRTYIFKFKRSDGIKVYAGKRESVYENPELEPYHGSGTQIKRAFKKYGADMFVSREWFTHDIEHLEDPSYELGEIEKALIKQCKELYGDDLTNDAEGGNGGDTLKYATKDKKLQHGLNVSRALKGRIMPPHEREAISLGMQKPEVKAKRAISLSIAQKRPDVIEKKRKSGRLAKRTAFVWQIDNYLSLYDLWMSQINIGNQLKYVKFAHYCGENSDLPITASNIKMLVIHFERVLNGEEEPHHPLPLQPAA